MLNLFFKIDPNDQSHLSYTKEIQEEQDKAEVIVSWSQFLFSIFMLVSWVISIVARKVEPDYEIVPYVLIPYGLFSLAKISWAKKRLVNDAVLTISAIIDTSVVTILIWLFHIQYAQIPGFYLKVPTFIYYFFFISLRALRYDTKYLFLTGISSIASWYALLAYALQHKDSIVSRSFVEYTKSHRILVGAEIEKTIGFAVVTVALAIAVYRKRNLLNKSVADRAARLNLTRFFSEQVAQAINTDKDALLPGNGTTRFASILMVDLRSFSTITNNWPPHDILKLISEYQDIVVPIILENNGCIDKYMGDGIFAHFGAAGKSTTFAKDAVTAMERINLEMEKWNQGRQGDGRERIEIGQAMSVGRVVFGTTGDKNRLEFTTIGATVNLTAKLEKLNRELNSSSVTTVKAYRLAEEQGYQSDKEVRHMKSFFVKDIGQELDLVVLNQKSS